MKKSLLLILFLAVMLGISVSAFADAYTIGTGTSTQSYIPFYGLYDYGWSKTIYTAAEMQAAGVPVGGTSITGVSYYVGNTPVNYVSVDQRIYVRHTTATAIDATYIVDPLAESPAFTQVWMGDLTWNGSGWHNVLFSTPFAWNGTDNLEILWYNWDGVYASGPNFRYTSTTPNYLACYKYSDGAMPITNGTTTYNRPNIRILDALVSPPGPPTLLAPIDTATDVIPGPTFSWSAPTTGGVPTGYKLYLNPLSNDFTGVTPILVPGTSYVHPATLPYSTLFYWKVAATNSGGDTDSAVWSFTTMADPTINTFPHVEGFEGGVTLPFGWTRTATGTPSYNWEVVTTDAHGATTPFSGTYFARLYVYLASTTYNPYCLVSPPIDLSSGNKRLSYYAWIGAEGATNPLDVEISIDGQATWIPLYSYNTAVDPTNAWIQNTLPLDAYTASNAYIRFKATSNYGSGFCDLGLDHIVLEDIPSGALFVINPDTKDFGPVFLNTTASQTFTVTNSGGGSLGIVSIEKTAGDTGYFQITNNTYTAPLGPGDSFTFDVEFTPTAEVDYTVTVTVTDDLTKTPHEVIITGTGYDPTVDTLPWTVDFTNVLGWTQTGNHWFISESANAGGTAPEAVCVWSPGETGQFRLISPPINIAAKGDYTLSFKHFLDYYATPATFRVQISTDLVNWTDIWTLVDPLANVGPETVVVPFTAPCQFYLAWVFDGYTYNIDYWYVDDITLEGSCPQVPVELSSFTATLTAQNYVQLSWVSQTESQMMGYLVYRNSTNDQITSVLIDQPMIPATNTSSTQSYTLTDKDVEIGTTYFYWLEAVDYTSSTYHGPVSVTVQGEVPPVLPEITSLRNAYPNPFKSAAKIEVGLKAGETGTVTIYNVHGQVVRTYSVSEGYHTLNWDGRDANGKTCASGIYFYRLATPSLNQTRRMVLAK